MAFIFSLTVMLVWAAISSNRVAQKNIEKFPVEKQAFVHFEVV
jgi:hypothetical protein